MQDVAITGIGLLSCLGRGASEHLDALRASRSGLRPNQLFDAEGIPPTCVGAVHEGRIDPDPRGSRTDRLALTAAKDALADAGLATGSAGVIALGTTTGGIDLSENHYLRHRGQPGEADRALLRRHAAGTVADRIGAALRLEGERHTFSTACSSSANAIGYAATAIAAGAPWALAGGADALCRLTFCGFHALKLLSASPCRPFDNGRVGMSLGEGAAFVVLEPWKRAKERGARAYAFVSGWGATADAYHMTAPDPEGKGAAEAMRLALADAGISPLQVDYVNAHGTATPANDRSEAAALHAVFGDAGPGVSSTKGATGHTLGAAGALEAAICALVLSKGFLPETIGLAEPDPELKVNHVPEAGLTAKLSTAISNSFGFGGNNACLAFTRGTR